MSYVWVECALKRVGYPNPQRKFYGRDKLCVETHAGKERERPEGPFRVAAPGGDKNQEKSLWTKLQRDHWLTLTSVQEWSGPCAKRKG